MNVINVSLEGKGSASYQIGIGYDIADGIGRILAEKQLGARYAIISDSSVSPLHGEAFLKKLHDAGLNVSLMEFPAGEHSKNINTVLDIAARMLASGVDRKCALIALGGGVVGDIVGFIASVYMRSLPYIQVPTTLVGQVDSSIGGKTAIDLREGKNLLGTFYQPSAVFIDLKFLETLPEREFNNGLAEIIKYGIIDDEGLFGLLEKEMPAVKKRKGGFPEHIVERCCRIKKNLVEIDERDQGIRHFLNFGHTIGHAIEAASEYAFTHGEAISLGMKAAARISGRLHGLPLQDRERIENLISQAGLPTRLPERIATDDIIARLKTDKKKDGDTIHFVFLHKIGSPLINGGVTEAVVRETIEGLRK
ncbi:MAG: 3-dehydroquinate synthase [Deltaproteobacteria bacterium]|nr:3-dehydroquinate synthase [Deltaproteobacteria bacterium]